MWKGGVILDVETIVDLINSVGFPMVVSGVLFWQNISDEKSYRETYSEFQKVITKNTETMNELITQLKLGN